MKFKTEEAKWAWLAALIDGEGWIGLFKHKDRQCKRQFSWRARVTIVNSKKALLKEVLRQTNEGIIGFHSSKETGTKIFAINFTEGMIRRILPSILPYLILKKKQARIVLKALKITEKHRTKEYNLDKVDRLMEELWQAIRFLNSGRLQWKLSK